jgi:Integrase core domain
MLVTSAAANAKLQQRVFNTFVQTYNEVRPHEALNDETPASRWRPPRGRCRRASPHPRILATSKSVA